jgi:hypothetical protein
MVDNRLTRRLVTRRALASGVLALALGAGAVGVTAVEGSTVASAASFTLTCRKIFGHVTTTVVVTKCDGVKGASHFAGPDILTGGTLTWGKTGPTTTYTGSATSPGEGICIAGRVEYDFTGTVTADTSTYVTVGDTVTYSVCINSTTNVVNLIKRTTATF